MLSTITANSSPPSRAHVSSGRIDVANALGHRDEQLVARGVAKAVVHGLEVVEVDEEDSDDVLVRRTPRASACAIRSEKSARFASPVSESWNAW